MRMIRLSLVCFIITLASNLFAQNTELVILNQQGDSVQFSKVELNGTAIPLSQSSLSFDNQKFCIGQTLRIKITHISYRNVDTIVNCIESHRIVIRLALYSYELNPATIQSKKTFKVTAGNISIQSKVLREHIGLLGIPDPLKLLQLSPGISIGLEGTNDIYIRGGKSDQTQLIFDNMYIFGPNHLFGLLSSVNGNYLGELNFYKGPIPIQLGFKASGSIEMFSSKPDTIARIGLDIGLITSSAYYKSPYWKNKFYISSAARFSYPDKIIKLSSDFVAGFYDVNFTSGLKLKKGEIMASAYLSNDAYRFIVSPIGSDFEARNFSWQNINGSLSLNQRPSSKRAYQSSLSWNQIRSYWADRDQLNKRNTTNTLINATYLEKLSLHDSLSIKYGGEFRIENNNLKQEGTNIHPLYIYNQWSTAFFTGIRKSHKMMIYELNLRGNLMHNFDQSFTAFVPEPRISISRKDNYGLLNLSFDRQSQGIQDLNNNFLGFPGTFWLGISSANMPIISDQLSLSYDLEKAENLDASVSGYFKTYQNAFDFIDGASLNPALDPSFQISNISVKAYGLETFLDYQLNKRASIRGSYSYSRVIHRDKKENINYGRAYPAFFDRPHNLNVTFNMTSRNKKIKFGSNAILQSNRAVSAPIFSNMITIYSDRNAVRLPIYRRLDVFMKYIPKPEKTKWRSEWIFSIYNVLNTKNVFAITYDYNRNQFSYLYLFPIIPMFSYQLNIR